jgi:hypothetical protein
MALQVLQNESGSQTGAEIAVLVHSYRGNAAMPQPLSQPAKNFSFGHSAQKLAGCLDD